MGNYCCGGESSKALKGDAKFMEDAHPGSTKRLHRWNHKTWI